MGVRLILNSLLLLLFTSSCLKAKAESSGSVVFLEGSSSKYLRNQPLDSDDEKKLVSVAEVAGAASVLLGFAPDFSFAAESSSKLNEILMPNPFDRPNAVFLLEVSGLDDIDHSKLQVQDVGKYKLVGSKASMHLPGEEEVVVTKIEESLERECTVACLDKEFTYLKLSSGALTREYFTAVTLSVFIQPCQAISHLLIFVVMDNTIPLVSVLHHLSVQSTNFHP